MNIAKLKSALASLAVLVSLAVAAPGSAAVVNGTLYNSGAATVGTIDFWSFTQVSAGTTDFDMLSWEAFPTFFDTQIWLFSGSVADGNLVAVNDDSGLTFGDGSTSGLDSFMSVALIAGDYILAVARCCTTVTDITDDMQQEVAFQYDSVFNAATTGQYQLTITGDIANLVAVPEPATLGIVGLGLGMAGLAAMRRRRRT